MKQNNNAADGDTNPIHNLHQRPANPRWNQELHPRRRSMNHGPLSIIKQVEKTIEEALDNLTLYYTMNSLRAHPEKNTSHFAPYQEQRVKQIAKSVDTNNTDRTRK